MKNITHAKMDEAMIIFQIEHLKDTQAVKELIDKKLIELKSIQRQRKIEDMLYGKY